MPAHLTRSKVGKPCNVADAGHVDFPKFGGKGAPMVVDIGGVRQGLSDIQAVYEALRYLLRFCRSFEVKFWFPILGEQGLYGGWPSWR